MGIKRLGSNIFWCSTFTAAQFTLSLFSNLLPQQNRTEQNRTEQKRREQSRAEQSWWLYLVALVLCFTICQLEVEYTVMVNHTTVVVVVNALHCYITLPAFLFIPPCVIFTMEKTSLLVTSSHARSCMERQVSRR